jgi:hypothetical protein
MKQGPVFVCGIGLVGALLVETASAGERFKAVMPDQQHAHEEPQRPPEVGPTMPFGASGTLSGEFSFPKSILLPPTTDF